MRAKFHSVLTVSSFWSSLHSSLKWEVWGKLGAAERSYPTSEVRCRSREDPMPKGRQPRGVTPCPRWGAAAESARLRRRVRGQGPRWEESPRIWGQGQRPGGATPRPNAGIQGRQPGGATHAWGQGQWPGGPTPRPGSRGFAGTGGPRGAIPRLRSGGATVRRYPSSKVRSSGCALLEQPWRDTPRPT